MSARDNILASAALLAQQQGPLGLTIDRVVNHANVSKGSFFHYFKTKDDMVAALLAKAIGDFEVRLRRFTESGASFHQSLISATIDEIKQNTGLLAAFIAAVAVDRKLADQVATRLQAWNTRLLDEGLSQTEATAVRLMLDGMLMQTLLRPSVPDTDELFVLAQIGEMLVKTFGRETT